MRPQMYTNTCTTRSELCIRRKRAPCTVPQHRMLPLYTRSTPTRRPTFWTLGSAFAPFAQAKNCVLNTCTWMGGPQAS